MGNVLRSQLTRPPYGFLTIVRCLRKTTKISIKTSPGHISIPCQGELLKIIARGGIEIVSLVEGLRQYPNAIFFYESDIVVWYGSSYANWIVAMRLKSPFSQHVFTSFNICSCAPVMREASLVLLAIGAQLQNLSIQAILRHEWHSMRLPGRSRCCTFQFCILVFLRSSRFRSWGLSNQISWDCFSLNMYSNYPTSLELLRLKTASAQLVTLAVLGGSNSNYVIFGLPVKIFVKSLGPGAIPRIQSS